jgi:quercetin dioxygenase-like cupin family protein
VATPFVASAHGIVLAAARRMDVAVARVTLQPGASSGWHRHPGPTVVTVTEGQFTVTIGNCRAHTYRVGETFVEPGPARHVGDNKGTTTTRIVVTFFMPHGAPDLNIPAPAPRCAG